MLRQSHLEARRLISGVRPPILDESGVLAAIAHLVNEQSFQGGPQILFRSNVKFNRLARVLENVVYRIVQEGLTNAARHSQSKIVRVHLLQRGEMVRIEIQDLGIGFDPKKVRRDQFGLAGIREQRDSWAANAAFRASPARELASSWNCPWPKGRRTSSSPLKKGTGPERTSENPRKTMVVRRLSPFFNGLGNRSHPGWGLVHFSANRRILRTNGWPKTWTFPHHGFCGQARCGYDMIEPTKCLSWGYSLLSSTPVTSISKRTQPCPRSLRWRTVVRSSLVSALPERRSNASDVGMERLATSPIPVVLTSLVRAVNALAISGDSSFKGTTRMPTLRSGAFPPDVPPIGRALPTCLERLARPGVVGRRVASWKVSSGPWKDFFVKRISAGRPLRIPRLSGNIAGLLRPALAGPKLPCKSRLRNGPAKRFRAYRL